MWSKKWVKQQYTELLYVVHYLQSACKNLALLDTTLQKGVLQNDGLALDINDLMIVIGDAFDIVHSALY